MSGPPPKDPSKRARRNADPIPQTVLRFSKAGQPRLPPRMPVTPKPTEAEPDPTPLLWPAQTRSWWKMWAESPLSENFGTSDWSYLLDTAVLHGLFWHGGVELAGELRLRQAKFGVTPEDRARLRIVFADADQADAKRPEAPSAKERRGVLRSLPKPAEAAG